MRCSIPKSNLKRPITWVEMRYPIKIEDNFHKFGPYHVWQGIQITSDYKPNRQVFSTTDSLTNKSWKSFLHLLIRHWLPLPLMWGPHCHPTGGRMPWWNSCSQSVYRTRLSSIFKLRTSKLVLTQSVVPKFLKCTNIFPVPKYVVFTHLWKSLLHPLQTHPTLNPSYSRPNLVC